MTMGSGRIRKAAVKNEITWLVDGQMENIKSAVLELEAGHSVTLSTNEWEFGFVLVEGQFSISTESGQVFETSIREDIYDKPSGIIISRDENIEIKAIKDSVIGVGSAPAQKKYPNKMVSPSDVGGGERGKDNWTRDVNFVIWNDNTQGNMLMMGETLIPSGNWATIPPHRHDEQHDDEAPYNEIYYFRSKHLGGIGLAWQFNDSGDMDQAFSIKSGDSIYMDEGYHPIVSFPGGPLYQLTIMSGPLRESKARLHSDYKYIIDSSNMVNPYANQRTHKDNTK